MQLQSFQGIAKPIHTEAERPRDRTDSREIRPESVPDIRKFSLTEIVASDPVDWNTAPLTSDLLESTMGLVGAKPITRITCDLVRPEPPPPTQPSDVFVVKQQWEGIVKSVEDGAFVAEVYDTTTHSPTTAEEIAEFAFDDVSPSDRKLIEPGAIFYWTIGYLRSPWGEITNAERIRFRRLPAWSREERKRIQAEAREMMDIFGIDDDPPANQQVQRHG